MMLRRSLILIAAFASALSLQASVLQIAIDGVIHPITAEFVGRAVTEAERANHSALLIEMRTPGGLEESTREIVNHMLASKVPVIVWVGPSGSRAASAGFFILQAADVATMAPGTNSGAAHPVPMSGGEPDETMKEKIRSDAAAFIRSIVAQRGRNVEAAESAVIESRSFTAQEALEERLIELIAANRVELLQKITEQPIRRFDGQLIDIDLRSHQIIPFEMTLRQRVLGFLMNPNIAFLLLALGIMGLWAEFSNPGTMIPGVAGLVAIIIAAFALNLLPTRFAAIVLIAAALILFILEVYFATGGILAAGGIICLTLGGVLLVDGPIPELRVNPAVAIAIAIPIGLLMLFLTVLSLRARGRKAVTGEEGMIGKLATARTPLGPEGKVFFEGEIWNAVSTEPVDAGASVKIRAVRELILEVEPATTAQNPTSATPDPHHV
jgi:membrane-bound serine protease (ClpP class)